jgi:hypothetical protein
MGVITRDERERMIRHESRRVSGIVTKIALCFKANDDIGFKENFEKFMAAITGFNCFDVSCFSVDDIVDFVKIESNNGNYIAKILADKLS